MAPLVLLLRQSDDPDPYEGALRAAGFRVRSVPVLTFRPVNQDALRTALANAGQFGSFIITSPRAAAALEVVLSTTDAEAWRGKPAYVVGPSTGVRLKALGFRAVGEEAGSAEALARIIINGKEQASPGDPVQQKPLLFLAGNRARDVLPEQLRAAGIPLEILPVYETHARADLDLRYLEVPDWIVFFSPSGIEAVRQAPGFSWDGRRRAAIGPATAEALQEIERPAHAVAEAPTPEALVRALQNAG